MEYALVAAIVGVLLLVGTGHAIWVWLVLLLAALWTGYRTNRQRCRQCGGHVLVGRALRYCNQCGAEQAPGSFRIRCHACRGLVRSEIGLNYCNRCGAPVTP